MVFSRKTVGIGDYVSVSKTIVSDVFKSSSKLSTLLLFLQEIKTIV
jgi:hypothetical protein